MFKLPRLRDIELLKLSLYVLQCQALKENNEVRLNVYVEEKPTMFGFWIHFGEHVQSLLFCLGKYQTFIDNHTYWFITSTVSPHLSLLIGSVTLSEVDNKTNFTTG